MRREIIFCTLLCCNIGALAKSVGEKQIDDGDYLEFKAEDESKPPRPGFPLFTLPSLPSLNFPQISLPQLPSLQALNIPNPFPLETVKATKTEYVEVTRRQTIHPVCYTAYAVKAPCLPYRQKEGHKNNGEEYLELHTANHVQESYDLYGDEDSKSEQTIRPTAAVRMMATPLYEPEHIQIEDSRSGKYLEYRDRPDKVKENDEVHLEGSETAAPSTSAIRIPFVQRQTTEYVTKTVLITKLEKYTDHRVTATMVAHNCLPVDPAMPRCKGFINPIFDAPIHSIIHQTEIEAEESKKEPVRDNVQNEKKVTAVEKIDDAPIIEEADPEEGKPQTTK